MPPAPRRLKVNRLPQPRRLPDQAEEGGGIVSWPSQRHLLRRLRAVRRAILIVLFTLLCMPVQALLLALPGSLLGHGKIRFARFYWSCVCRLLGLRVRVIGARLRRPASGGRPVVFVSNHSSWVDVPVLGGRLDACFIAKEEVGRWPLIAWIARLGRTVYVRRRRSSTARERDDIRARLAAGDNLFLFPEGTTSDGSRVLPFRSALFSVFAPAADGGAPPLLQPVSVVYDRLAYLPAGRATRPLFAWYGDMDIASHFWRLAQHRGLRATVLLHAPLDPAAFPSRKALAQATWSAVAAGAATLRQNRPARPITVAPGSAEAADRPAFA